MGYRPYARAVFRIWDVYPGSRLPDPGSKRHRIRFRNTELTKILVFLNQKIVPGLSKYYTDVYPGYEIPNKDFFGCKPKELFLAQRWHFLNTSKGRKPQVSCSNSGAAAEKHSQRESGCYHQASGWVPGTAPILRLKLVPSLVDPGRFGNTVLVPYSDPSVFFSWKMSHWSWLHYIHTVFP